MGTTSKLRATVSRGLAAALVAAGVTGAMALGTGVASASEGYYGELHYDHGEWSYYYHGSRYHGRDKCGLLRDTESRYRDREHDEIESDWRRACYHG
jgi:hypothetical protein